MNQWVVDTNVMVVANGRHDGDRAVASHCRIASVAFLLNLLKGNNRVLVDFDGAVLTEYRAYLNPSGQPGVGDRFLLELYRNVHRIQRVELSIGEDGEYVDLHPDIVASGFDPSDRKFAALALKENSPIANSVDSDWIEKLEVLNNCGIVINLLCGANPAAWYDQ